MYFSALGRSKPAHALAVAGVVFILAVVSAQAQAYGPPPPFRPMASVRFGGAYDGPRYAAQRTILGSVKDEDDQVVSSAMVYMKDVQAKCTIVMFADANGAFRFSSLSLDHDYEVWAESGEVKSPIRSVTSFMTQNEVTMPLRMRAERNQGTPTLKRRSIAAADAAGNQTAGH